MFASADRRPLTERTRNQKQGAETMETGTWLRHSHHDVTPARGVAAGHISQRLIGVIYLACAVAALLFALVTWWIGRLNPINALVFVLAVPGPLPSGSSGVAGRLLGRARMDEGQREMDRAAQSDAFYVAYLGLYALFFQRHLLSSVRDAMPVAIGVLLLLVALTWLGGYMWRRWRP